MKVIPSLAAVVLVCGSTLLAQTDLVNGVVVIVNDRVITMKDLNNELSGDIEFLIKRYPFAYQQEELNRRLAQIRAEKTKELVERQLILHEFETGSYRLPESYIENEINRDIREHGDRLTLTKTLQARGLTHEGYRKRVRETIIVQAMQLQNVSSEILVSPFKIERYYEENQDEFKVEDEVKLRMIVFPQNPDDPFYSPKRMAEETLAKIKDGAPFDEMARIYSQGAHRINGGDYGWVERSDLRQDLSENAFALQPGELTEVIEAEDGCYLILVEGNRQAHTRPLSEVRDLIEAALKDQERNRLRQKWIERLKDKSFIRYF